MNIENIGIAIPIANNLDKEKNTFDGVYFTDEQLEEIRNSIKDNIYPIVYLYDANKIYQKEFNAQKNPRGSLIMRV